MAYEEAQALRRRAEAFLRNALRLIDEGEYDLAIFNLEQYCQLILKYILLLFEGSYPRTHSIRSLIRRLGRYDSRALTLVDDTRNLHYIARLEEAYITARYLPVEYEEAEAKDIYEFVTRKFKPIMEEIISEWHSRHSKEL